MEVIYFMEKQVSWAGIIYIFVTTGHVYWVIIQPSTFYKQYELFINNINNPLITIGIQFNPNF